MQKREGHAKGYCKQQPAWSAFANDTDNGHGTLVIHNQTHMEVSQAVKQSSSQAVSQSVSQSVSKVSQSVRSHRRCHRRLKTMEKGEQLTRT